METLVYEDSPLAEYLEGEGEGEQDWAAQEVDRPTLPSPQETPTPNFAPRGPPRFHHRIRNKLPAPLQLDSLGRRQSLVKLRDTYSAVVSARIRKRENERFLEQLGYIIVASQLLNEQTAPSYNTKLRIPATPAENEDPSVTRAGSFGVKGAIITAGVSFSIVWLLHWTRSRQGPGWDLRRVLVSLALVTVAAAAFYTFAKRQWLRHLRREAVDVASVLVGNAQTFDSAASASVVLIQEVELVSRGYRLTTPLPPVSRLEEQTQSRRCLRLRRVLAECFAEMLEQYLEAKRILRPLTDTVNLEKYYDIYDFSLDELQDAASALDNLVDDKTSLRSLRLLFSKVYSARKGTLCCLLALPADGGDSDITKWSVAIEQMQQLASTTATCIQRLTVILNEQDRETGPPSPVAKLSPSRDRHRAQLRRLNSLSQGIRGLHAKMHLIREESDTTIERAGDGGDLGATLATLYESIGADLRGLLQEWEAGKSSLLANLENPNRLSRPVSVIKSPSSPTFSLSGVTAVEGSPTDALRALNGEDPPSSGPDQHLDDDEVFEAIAVPRKRNSMTREERIARMEEDRIRRATVRDKQDANTHMLRELETVIKLRPRGKVLEARLEQASLLKKVVEAIGVLVQDCNFDCNDSGIALQAMDNSHVALVSMMLKAEGFSPYRCDRNIALGINLVSLTKVLRAAQNEDILTLKAEDSPDVVNLVFESAESDRISEYDIKLMDIDQEHLAIPETEYQATVEMPSAEFRRICTDLGNLSESVMIETNKDGVKFSCQGEIGNGSVTIRQHTNVDKPEQNVSIALTEPVALTFSVKYLNNFCRATGLSGTVRLCLSQEVPLLVEYSLGGSGHLRFFLAPKIGEDE